MSQELLTSQNTVQIPVIIVSFGEGEEAKTFGLYSKTTSNVIVNDRMYTSTKVTYPNYVQSLRVKKINGTVNTYTLTMVYPITQNDDPNLIDRILSSVSGSRKVTFTYGDGALPSFMYREEEAIITDVQTQVDIQSSKLTYTIEAVSSAMLASSGSYTFPGYSNRKPSDVIKEVLYNRNYGLTDIFYGMKNRGRVEQLGLIPGDDKACKIEKQTNMTALNYLDYLISCMSSEGDSDVTIQKRAQYVMSIHDDITGDLNGPYFKITKVYTSVSKTSSIDYYTIDIGYMNKDYVMSFTVNDSQAYSILFDYSLETQRTDSVYRINGEDGSYDKFFSPSITNDYQTMLTTEAEKNYWSSLTSFPISATLKIKGILRAVILMSYLRLNIWFYGKKHNYSGIYIVTEQNDEISASGYSTTLSLTRVSGDENEAY